MQTPPVDLLTRTHQYDRWLHARANALLSPDLHRGTAIGRDDLVQIGRVAMWQAEKSYDQARGAEPYWLTKRANGAMLDALRPRKKHHLYVVPALNPELDDVSDPGPDLDGIMLAAYHEGDFAAALSELTPRQREYVHLRFWGDRSYAELTAHFGYEPTGVWAGARKKLVVSLGHLRGN